MRSTWWCAIIALAAAALIAFWPLTTAFTSRDALQIRVANVALVFVCCGAVALTKRARRTSAVLAIAAGVVGAAVLAGHLSLSGACVAEYNNSLVIIGRAPQPFVEEYLQHNPGSSAADLLLDAGGVAERVWTPGSVAACRLWLGWGALAPMSLFALSLCAIVAPRRFASEARSPAPAAPTSTTAAPRYDVFISYRHAEPDRDNACELLEALEAKRLRVAIDFRDFAPNEHFLSEMERCIRESRFTLCVITARYVDSDHCSEEAIISKTLDLADRRKRLVPLIFERVELPVWLHGLVGIDFTEAADVDPLDRLLALVIPTSSKLIKQASSKRSNPGF